MIHALLGLTVASAVLILWARGNLFACVFLTLLVCTAGLFSVHAFVIAALVALPIIWGPRYLRPLWAKI